jgi:hypothetical protein
MAQLSRPYQLGLAGIVLLAAAWLVLIQGHTSSSTSAGAGSSPPVVQTVTTTTAVPAKHAAPKGSKIYHGAAPGVGGLTSAIAKAQGAVETSKQNANTLEQKSAAASNEAAAPTHSSSAPASSSSTAAATAPAKALATKPTSAAKSAPAKTTPSKPTAPNASTRTTIAVNQRIVEAQLAKGKIAVILFWSPRGADDLSVRRAVQQLSAQGRLKIAVSYARASEVASFGTITRGIQVYGTPTLLVVNKKGSTITLTGLQDSFAIQQAISEARHP